MRPGSVIVDLAAESGGNVELTQPGKEVDVNRVLIIGTRNVANLLMHLVKDGAINLDFADEITKGACVTHGGEIVNERAKQLVSAS
jgi:NAD(P) transhydrogenase subunit alpha